MNNTNLGLKLVALKNHITEGFNESHWQELGVLTGIHDQVANHPRLLRSLSFGDEDYEGHVLDFLQRMVNKDPVNLDVIANYVQAKCPEAGGMVSSADLNTRRIVFNPLVFDIPEGSVDYNLVSVMMPFSGGLDGVYETIKNASVLNRMSCLRADDIWDDSTIIQDVFNLIFRSYIVVCDFTDKNPNVFYETGLAHALGKHVIPIVQHADDVPFDLRHHRFIIYLNNTEGLASFQQKLYDRIATLVAKRKTNPCA